MISGKQSFELSDTQEHRFISPHICNNNHHNFLTYPNGKLKEAVLKLETYACFICFANKR